jgi:UDP-N-acetylmuramoylalanine--D-glutamate ligase
MTLDLSGRRVLIWGYGCHGGGAAAARFCAAHQAVVEILDAKPPESLPGAASALEHGWAWHVGDGSHDALRRADLIVASPAIPPRAWPAVHPPATCPEGLFCAVHRGPRVAVTGTKGKSTTARILGCLLGWEVAGNSYEPLLDVLERVGPEAPLVCELSSFQLHYLSCGSLRPPAGASSFAAAIITSLAVDHLDWHPDLDHYHRAKLGVLERSACCAMADEAAVRADELGVAVARRLPTSVSPAWARDDLPLLGEHNCRNATLAITVAMHLGVAAGAIAPRLRQVRPLPHRLETVHEAKGLRFINDSIATTPEAAMAGIASFPGPLAVILGGSDKGATWERLAALVAQRMDHQRIVPVVIGQTGLAIAASLAHAGVTARGATTLADAVALAVAALPDGGTVLLSPACASFDMFQGFEDRGRQFAACARKY